MPPSAKGARPAAKVKRERKTFVPTPAHRKAVAKLLATRMPEADIAGALGIDVNALHEHFADELAKGKKARGGRPAFKPTKVQREMVSRLIACRMSHDDIARALDITDDTLRKHFADEIANGRAKVRAGVIQLQFDIALGGNASMAKHLETLTSIGGDGPAGGSPRKPAALGKKEARQRAAETPDTSTPMGALIARRVAAGTNTVN